MKTIKYSALLLLPTFFVLINSAEAEQKWWQKVFSQEGFDSSELSVTDISGAFKQALTIGAENVISQLGTEGGFSADEAIRIPLPNNLKKVAKVLKKIGLSDQINDLKLKMNQAAETAVPIAKDLFIKSIHDMTFDDVRTIYQGEGDSATQYFKTKMTASLTEKMQPIVAQWQTTIRPRMLKQQHGLFDKIEEGRLRRLYVFGDAFARSYGATAFRTTERIDLTDFMLIVAFMCPMN